MMWEKVRLGDVITIKNGKDHKKVNNPEGMYPIVGSGGIMGYADAYLCEANCTVIGRKGSINNPLYFEQRFWNVDTAFALCPGPKVNPRFFYYFCKTYNFEKHNKATTLPSLTKSDLEGIQIPLPPLPIQKRIAEILDTADALRRKDEALLKKYDELAQAIFIDMFGDPVKNEKGWEVKKFEEIATKSKNAIVDGPFGASIKESDYVENGIPIIRISNIRDEGFFDQNYKYLTVEKYQELIRSKVELNDILIARVGHTIGKTCIYNKKYKALLSTTGVAKASLNLDAADLLFITSQLNMSSYKAYIKTMIQGAGQPYLNLSMIKGFKFIIPSLQLQKDFSMKISMINNGKELLKNQTIGSTNLFNSLLQKAFNGELVA